MGKQYIGMAVPLKSTLRCHQTWLAGKSVFNWFFNGKNDLQMVDFPASHV